MQWHRAALTGAMLLALVSQAAAQDPPPPPPSPLDSIPVDTLVPVDSLRPAADTSTRARRNILLPLPLAGADAMLPAHQRIVLTRDSIEWAAARTVGDLLDRVPGVHLWRGGWLGRAEQPSLLGHGAGSVEYVVDGVPYVPVGSDSLAVDAASFGLSLIDRIEVERFPALLRVHLFTRRHDRESARTRIGVSSGDRSLARYLAGFEKRYPSGIGLGLGAEYFGVNAPQGGSGASNVTNGWIQLGWVPTPRFGVQAQALIQASGRDTLFVPDTDDILAPSVQGTRTDLQLRGMWRARDDQMGAGIDAFLARTRWRSDESRIVLPGEDDDPTDDEPAPDIVIEPASHDIGLLGGIARWRAPSWSAQLRAFHLTEWTPLDARLSLAWNGIARIALAVDGVHQQHDGDRESAWVAGRASAVLPLGLTVSGSIASGRRVATPAVTDAPEQEFTDAQVLASFQRARAGVEAGWVRTSRWAPAPHVQFPRIAGQLPMPSVDWAVAHARLAPTGWFTIESRYSHAVTGDPEGAPPHRAQTTATVRSKFRRNFPSGIFDLKVQGVVETWSTGVVGRDAEGGPIAMPGRTFVRGVIQLQIGSFTAYYDRVNFANVRAGTVPGYPIPGLATSFGVRWEFDG